MPNRPSGVNAYPEGGGASKYPIFYATIQPLTRESFGSYQCCLQADFIPTYPDVQSAVYCSNVWETNRSPTISSSFIPQAKVAYNIVQGSLVIDEANGNGGSSNLYLEKTITFISQCTVSLMFANVNPYEHYEVTFLLGSSSRMAILGEYIVERKWIKVLKKILLFLYFYYFRRSISCTIYEHFMATTRNTTTSTAAKTADE